MNKLTENCQRSFRQIYNDLPGRNSVKTPKTEFIERIASLTMKSEKTVRYCAGTQTPDALTQSL